jgi:hypothetical protein
VAASHGCRAPTPYSRPVNASSHTAGVRYGPPTVCQSRGTAYRGPPVRGTHTPRTRRHARGAHSQTPVANNTSVHELVSSTSQRPTVPADSRRWVSSTGPNTGRRTPRPGQAARPAASCSPAGRGSPAGGTNVASADQTSSISSRNAYRPPDRATTSSVGVTASPAQKRHRHTRRANELGRDWGWGNRWHGYN